MQNLLAFRFSNGIFEPLWNKNHVDHIQFTVAETVGVEGRGKYYDRSGVLRDMIQNHMFQMLAYLCMEPPASFRPDAIRNEKAKLLEAVRIMKPERGARSNAVRGQYGPGKKADGTPAAGYRQEPDVDPAIAAPRPSRRCKLFIDNWRWEGVPIYLRSGKSLWKRGTEIVVQFKKAPGGHLPRHARRRSASNPNRLIFHIQPDQGIELRFHAKTPGPAHAPAKGEHALRLQRGVRGVARHRLRGAALQLHDRRRDAVLAHRPGRDGLADRPADPGCLGRHAAGRLPQLPGRLVGTEGGLRPDRARRPELGRGHQPRRPGESAAVPGWRPGLPAQPGHDAQAGGLRRRATTSSARARPASEMYFICRGQVEVLDGAGKVLNTLDAGDFFGEMSLLLSKPRTASIRAATSCDLFYLDQSDFHRVLKDHPQFAKTLRETAQSRYQGLDLKW